MCRVLQVLVYPVEHTITKEIPWEVYEVASYPAAVTTCHSPSLLVNL